MKQRKYKTIIITLLIFTSTSALWANGGEHNDSTEKASSQELEQVTTTAKSPSEVTEEQGEENSKVFKSLSQFPNLHPLVVHFPIVLLMLAFVSQLTGFFVFQKPLSWVTILLLLGGVVGAVLATNVFHPHTSGLSDSMQKILEEHEMYASLTSWLAIIALFLKIISHNWLNRKMWAEIIVLILLGGSAITVSLAGHLGSQMVHIEGIGPKGNYLEQHEE